MGLYSDFKLDNGEYIPQYAGAPLEEVKQTADALSTRHYQNLAQANSLDILAHQLKADLLPGARSYVDQHISALDDSIREMATYGGENSTARINALASALKGDEGLIRATNRAKEYNEQTKLIDALRAKGDTPLYDVKRRQALEQAKADSELYNTPYASAVEPYKNPEPEMEDIWKVVNPDSYESEMKAAIKASQAFDPSFQAGDPALFFETITKGGISNDKITNMLEGAWMNYKNTPSYKQQTGSLIGKSDNQLKQEFYQKGLMRIFNNLKRDYQATPAWSARAAGIGGKGGLTPFVGLGQPLTTNVPYGPNGKESSGMTVNPALGSAGGGTSVTLGVHDALQSKEDFVGNGDTTAPAKGTAEFHPQYIADTNAAKEILGPTATAQDYNNMMSKRVVNAWEWSFPQEIANDISDKLQREYSKVEYLDPNTGKIVRPDTDEFKDLTGGRPQTFKVASKLDPKNHYRDYPGAGETFSTPFTATGFDKDGQPHSFIIATKPGWWTTTPDEIQVNNLYRKASRNMGKEVSYGSTGVKVKMLAGNQVTHGLNDQQKTSTTPLIATVPGYADNQPRFYYSFEDLNARLRAQGINIDDKD